MLEEKFNLRKDFAKKCLLKNKHNHATTTYYLLYQKYERLGMLSKDDELDLLSEEEGDNLQDFKLGESQTQRADEDNLMSPDAFSAQKLSLT